jgi:uncharacterized protein (TIGR03437 family)
VSFSVSWCADLSGSRIITSFAGAAHTFSGDGASAVKAALSGFQQVQTDRNGNVIFADVENQVVSRLNADGTLTVLAGNGIGGFSGEGGPARNASLSFPSDVVMDKAGNLYIYDSLNFRIRRVTPDGIISTIAGTGVNGYSGDGGPATQAQIQPSGKMAIDATGTLYFTDGFDAVIRRITTGGIISTYAGTGSLSTTPNSGNNGPALKASLGLSAGGIAVDGAGNLYVAEDYTNQIRKISSAGIISTVAGSGDLGLKDGPAASAQFYTPFGIALDAAGSIYVADSNNGVVRKISAGVVSTVAGSPNFDFKGDGGPALLAAFRFPEGVTVGGDGNLYIVDTGNFRIRAVSPNGTIQTVAGNGQFEATPDGTPAEMASLSGPNLLSFDPSGRLLIADGGDFTVRLVNSDGRIHIVAGLGIQGVGQGYQLVYGGPATGTLLGTPTQAVADGQGNIYIADEYASAVYKITPDGNLNLFAGQVGVYQFGGDGIQATSSSFTQPQGLALDQSGNLYVSDPGDNRIRKISTAGVITTFAGNGTAGFSGDGGAATQAELNFPQGIAFDSNGDLIIADRANNRLRMVSPGGNITTIAGNGTRASTGNGGPATSASVNLPTVVATSMTGEIYLIELPGSTVRQISSDGIISLVAGNGQSSFGGDGGPAIQAALSNADGLAVDSRGNLYISDFNNNRVRVVLISTPSASASPTSLSFVATSGGPATSPQAISVSSSLSGLQMTASSDSPWLKVPTTVAYAPGSISVSADPSGLTPGTYQGTVSLQSPGLTAVLTTVHVTFRVNFAIDPSLATDASSLTFSLTRGSPQSQSLQVVNNGSGHVAFFTLLAGAASTGLASSISQGMAQPNAPVAVTITADPSKLPLGTSTATLYILGTNLQFLSIPITVTLSPNPQKLALSQGGFTFVSVPGGGVTPPQTFEVLNTGAGSFNWTAQAATRSGGNWLSIGPNSGSSSVASFGSVTVTANPGSLGPGVYYGTILVTSTTAVNSPQQFEVVLNVLSPQQSIGATVAPSGMIFTAPAGGIDPSSQTFLVTNLNATNSTLAAKVTTTSGGNWLLVAPDNGSIGAGASQNITVQPKVGALTAGVYKAAIALQVGGMPLTVSVIFVVVPSVPPLTSSAPGTFGALDVMPASCAPSGLYPVFVSLTQGFVVPASWPLPIQVQAVDDCGSPMTSGRIAANFSNGDPRLSLLSLQNGLWQGIWLGHNLSANQIVITANADMDQPTLHGSVQFAGMLSSNPGVPFVNSNGVTSGAGLTGENVVAPGDVITISGQNFAAAPISATTLPLNTDLATTEVLFAGVSLPLLYADSGKILAIVPYDLPPNAQHQLFVSRGAAISGPMAVTEGTAQPDILKVDNTGSPSVAASVWNQLIAGTAFDLSKAGPSTALKAGDPITIYCTGLGPIDQPLGPNMPAGVTAINVTNVVTASVGGQIMPVSFAGLVPGYAGIYEVTGTMPSGVASGNVPITVSVAGVTSAAVQVSVATSN